MIDWLYSKITVVIVVFILIAFFLGFFKWHTNNIAMEELQNISDEVAGQIDFITSIDGETQITVTFDDMGEGVRIPTTISNKPYTLNITTDLIFAEWKGAAVASPLTFPDGEGDKLHFWHPEKNIYTRAEVEGLDNGIFWNEFESGYDFVIERKLLEVSAFNDYHTFVYLASELPE